MNNSCNKLIIIDDLALNSGYATLLGTSVAGAEIGMALSNNDTVYTIADENGEFSFLFNYTPNSGWHFVEVFIVNCCEIICGLNSCCGGNCKSRSRCRQTVRFNTGAPCPALFAPVITSPQAGEIVSAPEIYISGTAMPNCTVELCIADQCIQTTADCSGNFDALFPANLPEGSHTLTATVIIPNTECLSDSSFVTFNLEPYIVPVPVITFPSWDETIYNSHPLITGTGIPGYTVSICLYEYETCEPAFVDANGFFSLTFPNTLTPGIYHLISRQIDTNGISSTISTSRFYVETP